MVPLGLEGPATPERSTPDSKKESQSDLKHLVAKTLRTHHQHISTSHGGIHGKRPRENKEKFRR